MLDGIGGRAGLTWNSVTDAGGTPVEVGDGDAKSGFEFDLGSALARLGDDAAAPSQAQPSAPAPSQPEQTQADPTPPSASDPAPRAPTPTPAAAPAPQAAAPVPPAPVAAPPAVPASVPAAAPRAVPTPSSAVPTPPAAPQAPAAAPSAVAPTPQPGVPASPTVSSSPPRAAVADPSIAAARPTDPTDVFGQTASSARNAPAASHPPDVSTVPTSFANGAPERDPFGGTATGADAMAQRAAGSSWNEPLPARDPFGGRAGGSDPEAMGQRAAGSSWTEPLPERDPFGGRDAGPGVVTFDRAEAGVPPVVASAAAAAPAVRPQPAEPVANNYPRRVPGTHFDSQRQPDPAPVAAAPAPAVEPVQPVRQTSVFDDGALTIDPVLPGSATSAPGLPSSAATSAVAGAPTLPEVAPAPPPIAEPAIEGSSSNDITALRSAQKRASRQQRQGGRLFGRSLLAFVVIGGVLGAGLYFGRTFLFPTDWDAQLTPIVNELQDTTGAEFDDTVPLVAVPPQQFGDQLGAATIGNTWARRVPEWRALGLASGEVNPSTVGATFATTTSAFYDPDTRTIYRSDAAVASEADLRVALVAALDDQESSDPSTIADGESGDAAAGVDAGGVVQVEAPVVAAPGLTGVSPLSTIAERAVDRFLVVGPVDARSTAPEMLPIPLAYEVAAVDVLGEPILVAAGVDRSTLTSGGPYPDSLGSLLDDRAVATTGGLLQPGEISLAEPMALGTDDWSLVWASRLPAATVDALVDQVIADSYHPIERAGTVCFVGVFETADEATGGAVLGALQSWAANAPAGAQAAASALGPTRIQLQACDPGASVEFTPNIGVADALVDRQQRRLTN